MVDALSYYSEFLSCTLDDMVCSGTCSRTFQELLTFWFSGIYLSLWKSYYPPRVLPAQWVCAQPCVTRSPRQMCRGDFRIPSVFSDSKYCGRWRPSALIARFLHPSRIGLFLRVLRRNSFRMRSITRYIPHITGTVMSDQPAIPDKLYLR